MSHIPKCDKLIVIIYTLPIFLQQLKYPSGYSKKEMIETEKQMEIEGTQEELR